jgi:hypothetical protein
VAGITLAATSFSTQASRAATARVHLARDHRSAVGIASTIAAPYSDDARHRSACAHCMTEIMSNAAYSH